MDLIKSVVDAWSDLLYENEFDGNMMITRVIDLSWKEEINEQTDTVISEQYIQYSKKEKNLKRLLQNGIIDIFGLKENSHISNYDSNSVVVTTKKYLYIEAFLALYFSCIDKYLSIYCKNLFEDGHVSYVVCVEKKLLDDFKLSKEKLRRLMYEGGMTQFDGDNSKQCKIITKGEGLLPAIQKASDFKLPIKAYYVLAQIHRNYIQLTLNQVVKVSADNDEATEIIIRDKLIPIEDIDGSLLCQHL
jgi:hypothetical protein